MRWASFLAVVNAALVCAPAAVAKDSQTRIIGGSPATEGAYPYQVALFRSNRFICGGSIVDQTTVITAAHCVTRQSALTAAHSVYSATLFTIGYGSTSRSATTKVRVSQISVPPPYVSGTDESYDVARLTLSTPIPFGPSAQPIPLASATQSKTTGLATITGWGNTVESDDDETSEQLLATQVSLRDDDACQATYPNEYLASRSVCAGGTTANGGVNPDTCQGDSGGPLAVNDESGQLVLLGVTSYGDGCGRDNTPAVYAWVQGTDIPNFLAGLPFASTPTPAAAAAPAPAPAAQATLRDVTRPTVRYSKFSCTKKRRCTVRLRAADNLGAVTKLSAKVSRRVKTCTHRNGKKRCRTVTRSKTLKFKRASTSFSATATLARATYTLTAVSTDASGNRSATLRRTLRVKG